jgi:ABC-type Mn2+/Zn2+ transport system permease subunit
MRTSLKLKLVGLLTTIALFALPAADAMATRSW